MTNVGKPSVRGREALIQGRTRGETDKLLKSKLFLSFGKQSQRFSSEISSLQNCGNNFTEEWKLASDVFLMEPNVTNCRFILF